MKDEALALIADLPNPMGRLNLLREYVQSRILRSLHESEAFTRLSFVGGTALRFVFGLRRFSEDLDFSLERKRGYQGERWMKKLKSDLQAAGFDASISWNERATVHKASVGIAGLLGEAGLAATSEQKLSIKIEIDTRPPVGARLERRLISRYSSFVVQHHDLPSLMAGKINALLTRRYAKGRDWYDLTWYRGQRPPVEPNTLLLRHALEQTAEGAPPEAQSWRALIEQKLARLDCSRLAGDVAPFLERPEEIDLLTEENLRVVLRQE